MSTKQIALLIVGIELTITSSLSAESFTAAPVLEIYVGNDSWLGPDSQNPAAQSMHMFNTDSSAYPYLAGAPGRQVAYSVYDLAELKAEFGTYFSDANLSIAGNYQTYNDDFNIYGVLEAYEDQVNETMTWNKAPGLKPAALGAPIELETSEITDVLITVSGLTQDATIYLENSEALAQFLNSDTNGKVVLMFSAPSGNETIIYSLPIQWDAGVQVHGNVRHDPLKASYPKPASGQYDVYNKDIKLAWTAGASAVRHDVYLGTDFNDVSDATTTVDPNGVYKGRQDPNCYPAVGAMRLELGQTYYWRIDEVNAPPSSEVIRGRVWSFTVEPVAYAIPGETITATASSNDLNKGPENTVNGSGLDASGLLHGNVAQNTMWLSSLTGPQPTWIKYEFDKVYKLHEMWVWNLNDSSTEPDLGVGIKDVLIEYSLDDAEYTTLGTTYEFPQAAGTAGYEHEAPIDLEGVAAKYVRLTVGSNWGGLVAKYGLSEVRFFYIPVRAREPKTLSGATDVDLDVTLSWRPGRDAAEHDVYFGTDKKAVQDGTAPKSSTTEASYGPLSLELGQTYYWRVDEVNDSETPSMLEGDVWSFSTHESLVIDDFEIYDANEKQIWYTWRDGLGSVVLSANRTGSEVGDLSNTDSYTEETITHGGSQSMPFTYNNDKPDDGLGSFAKYSEAQLTLSSLRDWTQQGVEGLSLWFRGYPAAVGSFVENPPGIYTMTATGADIFGVADEFHFAYQTLTGTGAIQAQVLSVENTDEWAKAGVMIRETLEPGSKFAMVIITPGQGCRFQARLETDGDATSDTSVSTEEQRAITAPYWVRLERGMGGNFRGYYSADGLDWQEMTWNPQSISMDSAAYVGLALTSHNADATCQGRFSDVTIEGSAGGQWLHQDIGILSNDPEPMYVAVGNNSGSPAVVYHDDPNAAQIDEWTEWTIDLQDLEAQGVNLNDVNSLAIGFGDRDNPQAGGSGKMYFDDIGLYPVRCVLSRRSADFAMVDFVEDCIVDGMELESMAAAWLTSGDELVADLNVDTTVDFKDFAIVAERWLEQQLWPQR